MEPAPNQPTGDVDRGEGANYSLCETRYAGPHSPWHLRLLTAAGRKLGGGADTPALCGRSVAWDLQVEITEHHLKLNTCAECVRIYRKQLRNTGGQR